METITKEQGKETFEVTEAVQSTVVLPTREEAKEQGLTADEMDRAEKSGLITKKEEVKKEEPIVTTETKVEDEKKEEPKVKSSIPDFEFKTPEQEKAWLEAFPPGTPQRGLYFRMKNERTQRQAAQAQLEKAHKDREALEARVKTLEAGKTQEVDEDGNLIDPENKPLTLKEWREIQRKDLEEKETKQRELSEQAHVVSEANNLQEEYAKSEYADFDETIGLTTDLLKNAESLITEPWKLEKLRRMARDMQIAAAKAHTFDLTGYHAARIAYEIGQMHPQYGKKAETQNNGDASEKDGKSKDPTKANGGQRLTPEQMKRLEENTQRRSSSASVTGGGGKRTISADEMDGASFDKLSYTERQKFRQKHPDRYAEIIRG